MERAAEGCQGVGESFWRRSGSWRELLEEFRVSERAAGGVQGVG